MKAFKVVDRETRHGTNWALQYNNLQKGLSVATPNNVDFFENSINSMLLFEFLNPKLFPIYKKDSFVEMASNSIGLMIFGTKIDAIKFAGKYSFTTIVDVETIGDLLPSALIVPGCGHNIQYLKYFSASSLTERKGSRPPDGTIFCEKLKVLN